MSKLPNFLQDNTPFLFVYEGEYLDATVVKRDSEHFGCDVIMISISMDAALEFAKRTPYPDIIQTQFMMNHDSYGVDWFAYEIVNDAPLAPVFEEPIL